MHLKRHQVPNKWPIPRKGSVYIAKPAFNFKGGISLLAVIRDILKIARNKKEVKRAIHLNEILVNGKAARDERHSVSLFDTITIVPSKKNYRMGLTPNGKFDVKESNENESWKKTAKIIGKKILKKKKLQFNLSDGSNLLSDAKYEIGDSLVLNLKSKKVEKHIPLKEKADVLICEGKHAGEVGKVSRIIGEHKMIELDVGGKKINVLTKQIMATE